MEIRLLKTKDDRYCEARVALTDGCLTVTGGEGRIITREAAKREALDYWRTYFEDSPDSIREMNERCGSKCRTPTSAARYVLAHDGEFHGLDVDGSATGPTLRILESCGQIVETLREWFPELAPLLPYHLNNMHAGCEHQEALGWGDGHDVALSKDELTPAQRETLAAECHERGEQKRERELKKRLNDFDLYRRERLAILEATLGRAPSVHDEESTRHGHMFPDRALLGRVRAYLEKTIAAAYPDPPIESTVYKDSIDAPCPVCGYRYGTAWLRRELPPEVIAQVNALIEGQKGA